jgi:hypothetical protein
MDSEAASGASPVAVATQAYERWLHKQIDVVEADLKLKHGEGKSAPCDCRSPRGRVARYRQEEAGLAARGGAGHQSGN